jgi:ribose transport system substrate-binding protein
MKQVGKLILVALVALAVAGCGQKSATTKSSAPGKSGLTIALVTKSTSHDFWQTVNAGAQAAGKETGATVIFKGPSKETDVAGQMTMRS